MAKQSGFLKKIQAQNRLDGRLQRLFAIQMSQDMAVIALHREFGFGPERIKRFVEAFNLAYDEFSTMALDDAQGDFEMVYSKEKVDEALREACGENFKSWEERYRV